MKRAGAALLVLVAVVAGGCGASGTDQGSGAGGRFPGQVALPAPQTSGGMSLQQAIAGRRSTRSFGPEPLSLAEVGQLLWAAQGVTGPDGKRAAPSAGALYPLELYVVTATEVLHYLPVGHRVELRHQPDLRPRLQAAAGGQPAVGSAPDLLVVAARVDRTRQVYGSRAERFVDLEAGHVAENVLLQATADGLAAVPIGSFDAGRVAGVLDLPAAQSVVYLIPLGPRP